MSNQISCINKLHRLDPHESIQNIGGVNSNGRWKLTLAEAINYIETGKYEFHVNVSGHSVRVIVAVSRYGNKYLKTESDDDYSNNLLNLPECP